MNDDLPSLSRREWDTLGDKILNALSEREEALRVPLLGSDLTRVLSLFDCPSWLTKEHGEALLTSLEIQGRISRLLEVDLVPLIGKGLPLRRYWGDVSSGWTVFVKPKESSGQSRSQGWYQNQLVISFEKSEHGYRQGLRNE